MDTFWGEDPAVTSYRLAQQYGSPQPIFDTRPFADYLDESGRRLSEGFNTVHGAIQNNDFGELFNLGAAATEPFTGAKGRVGQALDVAKSLYRGEPKRHYADGGEALPMRFPWGPRYNEASGKFDSPDLKGVGFYGPMKTPDGSVAGEYSSSRDGIDYTNFVPGLTAEQLRRLIRAAGSGQPVPEDVADIAWNFAKQRVADGKSPFWDQRIDPYPAWSPDQEWPAPRIGFADGGWADPTLPIPTHLPTMDDVRSAWNIAKQYVTHPTDPYEEAGKAVQQYHAGDTVGAFETMAGSMPQTGIFAGPRALTADRDALQMAHQMAHEGAEKKNIFDKTGWFRGPDGKWRFEIPDYHSSYRPEMMKKDIVGDPSGVVGDVLDHKFLFEAYPDIASIQLGGLPHTVRTAGSYFPPEHRRGEMINLNSRLVKGSGDDLPNMWRMSPSPRSTLLHEIQHAIQSREGFSGGSNLEMAGDMDRYLRSAGEVEARNVQDRIGMPEESLMAVPPWRTEDTPFPKQIVRFSDGGAVYDALRIANQYT